MIQNQIIIGIVGIGAMGKGLMYQSVITPGFNCVCIADIDLNRAISCAEWLKKEYQVVHNLNDFNDVIRSGKVAVTDDGHLLSQCDLIDVFIEASNSIDEAGLYCEEALISGKHVIMMNAEADLIFGPYFLHLANENKVVYTSCDGDQHGVLKQLVDDLKYWGFELVMAGNIKGFLDRYSNPEIIISEADKRKLDYKMATAYTDGTKLNIEMSILANALNLKTKIPGMIGLEAKNVNEVLTLYDFEKLWHGHIPFVDYILGAKPEGGVFAVGYCEDHYQRFMLNYYKMGEGPYYIFYRPYHLCHVEALKWIAKAAREHIALLKPDHGFVTEVIAYAKKDMKAGELLDGIGGYSCYGLIENKYEEKNPSLPICLAENVSLKRAIQKDQRILLEDVNISKHHERMRLYGNALAVHQNQYNIITIS